MPENGEGVRRDSWEGRLQSLELALPEPPSPLGSYTTASQVGELLFLSGMLPLAGGKLALQGRIGAELSIAQGREAALIALLNGLAVARKFAGSEQDIERVVRLGVAMATTADFTQHPAIADAASQVVDQIFSDAPRHVRLITGVQSLSLGAPLALELIFAIRATSRRG